MSVHDMSTNPEAALACYPRPERIVGEGEAAWFSAGRRGPLGEQTAAASIGGTYIAQRRMNLRTPY